MGNQITNGPFSNATGWDKPKLETTSDPINDAILIGYRKAIAEVREWIERVEEMASFDEGFEFGIATKYVHEKLDSMEVDANG